MASNIDEKTLKKEGVCAASLPTTMGIVAGFLVQNALKYLLKFGTVTHYLGYNALEDFFPTMKMKPNPNCDNKFCVKRQKEFALIAKDKVDVVETQADVITHEDNEWGICVVDETTEEAPNLQVSEGIALAYEPVQTEMEGDFANQLSPMDDSSLQDLMEQMKNL